MLDGSIGTTRRARRGMLREWRLHALSVFSLAVAFVLGVVHALSPGHGKTIMAAYLVGGRGSSRQAVALGLAVTVSHTLGVLALAGLTLAASSLLPPERQQTIALDSFGTAIPCRDIGRTG